MCNLRKYHLLITLPFILFLGCAEDYLVIKPIEEKIQIFLEEKITKSGIPELQFRFTSKENYPCSFYPVFSNIVRNQNKFRIFVEGTTEPFVCLDSPAPALGWLNLGYVAIGRFELEFLLDDILIKGKIISTNQTYEIILDTNTKFILLNNILTKR